MQIPWLIAIAFWLSGGFIRSGLGARIAYSIVSLFGKTTLVRMRPALAVRVHRWGHWHSPAADLLAGAAMLPLLPLSC